MSRASRTPRSVLLISPDRALFANIARRLADISSTSLTSEVGSAPLSDAELRRSLFVLDGRGRALSALQSFSQKCEHYSGKVSAILLLNKGDLNSSVIRALRVLPMRELILADLEPVGWYIRAFLLDGVRGDVLVEAMRLLASRLSPLGQRCVHEVLSNAFACNSVKALASAMHVHRSTLVIRLKKERELAPKYLIGWCRTMVIALLARAPHCSLDSARSYVRLGKKESVYSVLKRYAGVSLRDLRQISKHCDETTYVEWLMSSFPSPPLSVEDFFVARAWSTPR